MNTRNAFLFALVTSFALGSCSHSPVIDSPATVTNQPIQQESMFQFTGVQSVLNTDVDILWSQDFDHYQDGLLL